MQNEWRLDRDKTAPSPWCRRVTCPWCHHDVSYNLEIHFDQVVNRPQIFADRWLCDLCGAYTVRFGDSLEWRPPKYRTKRLKNGKTLYVLCKR